MVGDLTAVDGRADEWLPQFAKGAIQSGRYAGDQLSTPTVPDESRPGT